MARPSKEQQLADIHADALSEFDRIQTAMRDERLQCLQDRRFYSIAGAQWEGPLGIQFENKPRFEVNKIHLAVIRIFNEYRNNRIDVQFVSKDGEDADQLADTCAALYRADEQDSTAEEAFDNGFEEAVGGGFGAWRLRTVYEDEEDDDNEKQRIRIEPIFDADTSVFFDLNAKRQDKADATSCYVLTSMTRDAYRAEYGDDPASWPKQIRQTMFDWLTPDVVYVAELYKVEIKPETVHIYRGLTGDERAVRDSDLADDEMLANELAATGYREVRQKKIKSRRVHKYIMSGKGILEDCGIIAGKCIPVVPVYGKRWFIDNVERCMGHVRLPKDAQRLKNMQLSKLGEYAAVSAISKPIFTPEQIAGHQQMWADDNVKNYPYLLINQLTDPNGNPVAIGPQAYTQAPDIPPAMAALLQLTEQDMQDMLGNQQQGDKIVSNISDKLMQRVQDRLDMQTFIYVSNMAKAIKRTGEVWLSMARDVYVEEGRKMKGIGPQGEVQKIEIARPMADENGEVEFENDLSEAAFDVAVEVGPSSTSRRSKMTDMLIQILGITQDPETIQVLTSMVMMNIEGEGMGPFRDYFRMKLIKMGVVKPNEEEAQQLAAEMQGAAPDANTVFLQASAEQAQADAVHARARSVLAVAQAEKTKAETAETLAGIDNAHRDSVVKAVQSLTDATSGAMPPSAGDGSGNRPAA